MIDAKEPLEELLADEYHNNEFVHAILTHIALGHVTERYALVTLVKELVAEQKRLRSELVKTLMYATPPIIIFKKEG